MKTCTRCKALKPFSDFGKNRAIKDGFAVYCKACVSEMCAARYAEQCVAAGRMTPDERRATRVERKEAKRQRDNDRRNFARFLETSEEYVARLSRDAANKQRVEAKARRRELLKLKRQNPTHRLCKIIGDQMRHALASTKAGSWSEYVDYTASELRLHLEAQFEPWMTWQNYGTEWHIDHKRPVSSFNLEDPDEVGRCWALVNLRPLHSIDNIAKSNRLDPEILDGLPDDFHPAHYVIFGEAAA